MLPEPVCLLLQAVHEVRVVGGVVVSVVGGRLLPLLLVPFLSPVQVFEDLVVEGVDGLQLLPEDLLGCTPSASSSSSPLGPSESLLGVHSPEQSVVASKGERGKSNLFPFPLSVLTQ